MGNREFVIDVGSSSIGACIADHPAKGKPSISSVRRIPIGTGSEESRAKIVERTLESLSMLLKEYAVLGRQKSVRVVLASPWYAARIRFVSSKSERPAKVNSSSISKTVREFKAKSENQPPDGVPLESIVTQVYINGYPSALEKTVMGTTLRVHLYESYADRSFIDAVTEKISSVFSGAKISFHSFPLLMFLVLRAIRDEENFTFVDAGGEVTDVAIVHRDSLRFLGSFPKGSLYLVRNAGEQGASISDTSSRLSLYVRDELSPAESLKFGQSFQSAVKPWAEDFQKTIEAAQTDTAVPQTTFIAADKEELRWFNKAMESVQGVFPARPILLAPDFFQQYIELGESAVYDAFLSVESLYFKPGSGKELAV